MIAVLSKCAHPVCFAQFRYLHQGKIYKINRATSRNPAKELFFEYFWLCESCSRSFKVIFREGGIVTVPLHLQLTSGEADQFRKAA
jgi:hypothetical protein